MRKFSYALFALLVLSVAGVGAYSYLTKKPSPSTPPTTSGVTITNRQASAFGTLGTAAVPKTAKLQAGSGTTAATPAADGSTSPSTSLIAPEPFNVYEYVYKGDRLTIPNLPVLKHVTAGLADQLQEIIRGTNLGLVNLGTFDKLKVQSLTLAQDTEKGYAVNVDLQNGMANIYTSWSQYGEPAILKEAGQATNTGTQTFPPDAEIIAAANAFLAAHDIAHSAYGQPTVNKAFLPYGLMDLPLRLGYQPTLEVVYPLVINGFPVVNESGTPTGINVFVDVATKAVTGVNNLTTLAYESSTYTLITDPQAVLDVVKRGGVYGATDLAGTNKVTIEVGTPSVGYLSSRYQVDQTATEYLVPAFIFPITKAPAGEPLYRTAVVVPLVKEVMQPPQILPLTSGGSSGAGSDGGVEVDTKPTQ